MRLLIGHLDALSGDKGLKRLRRAVRRAETGDDEEEPEVLTSQDVIPRLAVPGAHPRPRGGDGGGRDPRAAARAHPGRPGLHVAGVAQRL
ncbi:MAG: hypothetical protein R3F43_26730 [bacterium]